MAIIDTRRGLVAENAPAPRSGSSHGDSGHCLGRTDSRSRPVPVQIVEEPANQLEYVRDLGQPLGIGIPYLVIVGNCGWSSIACKLPIIWNPSMPGIWRSSVWGQESPLPPWWRGEANLAMIDTIFIRAVHEYRPQSIMYNVTQVRGRPTERGPLNPED